MKIEKIGEKKEGFLEKLGECYSISTKNGTLPPCHITGGAYPKFPSDSKEIWMEY